MSWRGVLAIIALILLVIVAPVAVAVSVERFAEGIEQIINIWTTD